MLCVLSSSLIPFNDNVLNISLMCSPLPVYVHGIGPPFIQILLSPDMHDSQDSYSQSKFDMQVRQLPVISQVQRVARRLLASCVPGQTLFVGVYYLRNAAMSV